MSKFVRLRPSTRAGRWSVAFLAAAVAAFFVMNAVVATGQTGGDTFADNWWISGPAFTALGCILCALVLGCFAVLRRGERSLPVLFAILLGALVTFFVVGEVTTPH